MGLLKGSCRQPSGGDWRACACAQHSDSFTYRHFRQGRDIFLLLSPPPQASRCLSSEAPFRLGRPGTFCLLKAAFPNAEGQSTRRGMDVKRREVDQQEHDVISKKKGPWISKSRFGQRPDSFETSRAPRDANPMFWMHGASMAVRISPLTVQRGIPQLLPISCLWTLIDCGWEFLWIQAR